MKNEIKEILDRLERIDHKEYNAFEFADSATFEEMARCFEERKKMADYITNLEKTRKRFLCAKKIIEELKLENEELQEELEYKELWRKEYKQRIDKAIDYINNTVIPFGDEWHWDNNCIEDYVNNIITILQGSDDND